LIRRARTLYQKDAIAADLQETVYALDSTTIDLCLSLFPWARFRRTKAAVKLHTLLDTRGSIPVFIAISEGKQADVRVLDELAIEPGAFYVMDRGYVDFQRLYNFVLAGAFFVTRSKTHLKLNRLKSRPVEAGSGVESDQIVWLRNASSIEHYSDKFRRIHFIDPETGKGLIFLTNNLDLPALTIALLYKSRWKVELFFKWIKQHLRIKHFFGTSENAVKTQVWISICVYVLVAIVKKQIGSDWSLYNILQVLSVTAFEQAPLHQVLADHQSQELNTASCNQLMLSY
jgi:hypothetical protein